MQLHICLAVCVGNILASFSVSSTRFSIIVMIDVEIDESRVDASTCTSPGLRGGFVARQSIICHLLPQTLANFYAMYLGVLCFGASSFDFSRGTGYFIV